MLKRMAMLMLAMAIAATCTLANAATAPQAKAKKPAPCKSARLAAPDQMRTNVVKILRTTNKAQTNSYVPVVFTMKNNNPFNVVRMLHRPVQQEEGLIYTFVNPDNKSGKVLYCVPAYMIPSLKKLVAALDVPGMTSLGGDTKVYPRMKHRRADSSDQAFLDTATSYLTAGATVLTDPENNAILIIDAPSGASTLLNELNAELDVPTPMVQLVVKIYELAGNNDAKLGLDYEAWKNSEGQNLFSVNAYDSYASAAGASYSTFNGNGTTYRLHMSSEFFDFLQAKGQAKVMNQVKIGALNERTATVSAGDQILYYAVSTSENSSRTVTGTTNHLDSSESLVATTTGLSLSFTPSIGDQSKDLKSVLLDMQLAWSDYTAFDSNGYPQINPRSIDTKLRLGVNEEACIGGIRRQETVKKTEKMPFLGSLPVIGYLFGGETATNKYTDMVVVVKPIGISDYAMAKMTTDEEDLVKQVEPATQVALPPTTVGYDQWLLDKAINVGVEPIK